MGVLPGKGQDIKNTKAATYSRFAMSEWIPCETDARLKIAKSLVGGPKRFHGSFDRTGECGQDGESVMGLGRQGHRLVTHAEVHRQIRTPMPIVLNIGSKKGLVHIDWSSRRRIVQCDGGGLVLKKSSQGGESKTSVGTGSRELIILHMFPG